MGRDFWRKLLCALSIVVFLFVNSHYTLAQKNDISVLVKTNKKVINYGERLTVWLEIVNNSNRNYSFSSWRLNHVIFQELFYDSHGHLLEKRRKCRIDWPGTIVDWRQFPLKDEYFRLQPFQKKKFKYQYKLKKGFKMVFFPKIIFGVFLENKKGDYVVVNSNRKIIIRAKYKPSITEISEGKIYGFKNMYKGEVVSNKVEIQMR